MHNTAWKRIDILSKTLALNRDIIFSKTITTATYTLYKKCADAFWDTFTACRNHELERIQLEAARTGATKSSSQEFLYTWTPVELSV
jgi:hypothetical protein